MYRDKYREEDYKKENSYWSTWFVYILYINYNMYIFMYNCSRIKY